MGVLLFFAFVSGLVTIFAPCIWPILPIILSTATTGGHRKPLGITLGIMLSFAVLTLSISYIVKVIPFDANILRYFAVVVIGFLGLTLLLLPLSEKLEAFVSRLSGKFNLGNQTKSSGFWSGFLTGATLGIVWTPCAGPILATIAVLAATQSVNFGIILVTLVYVTGIGIPLFIFATLGKYLFTRTRVLSRYTGRIQQVFGVILILSAVAIATNYDKVLEAQLLNAFPSYTNLITNIEGNSAVSNQLNALKGKHTGNQNTSNPSDQSTLPIIGKAPGFDGATDWLNIDKPLTMQDLKGKVVLVDFWTYTCINCIRTLPFVTSWYDKYKNAGFIVIGVHTPEFEFEKNTNNVLQAIKQFKIHYPVPQDNNYAIWNNFSNQYWPAEYLIDVNGNIRRTHFGEGEYDQTEKAIQALLKEAGKKVSTPLATMPDQTPLGNLSPETYVGEQRMQYYYPNGTVRTGKNNFTLANDLPENTFSFGGEWDIQNDTAITGKNAILNYHFHANKVFLVLRPGTAGKNAKVKVFLDGNVADSTNAGQDVTNGAITIDSDRLYDLIDLKGNSGTHVLKLEFQSPGIQAFAFTFG